MIDDLKEKIKKCKTEDDYYDIMYLFDRDINKILYDDEECRKALSKAFNQDEKVLAAILMINGNHIPDENEE